MWYALSQSKRQSRSVLALLELAGGRLTATGLEQVLANPAVQRQQGFSSDEMAACTRALQRSGFRWGLDGRERGGDETHSLRWCLDRWLLGLVLPARDGLAPGGAAPFQEGLDPERLVQWWTLLDRVIRWLQLLRQPRRCSDWVGLLQQLLEEWFGDGGDWGWERRFSGARMQQCHSHLSGGDSRDKRCAVLCPGTEPTSHG